MSSRHGRAWLDVSCTELAAGAPLAVPVIPLDAMVEEIEAIMAAASKPPS